MGKGKTKRAKKDMNRERDQMLKNLEMTTGAINDYRLYQQQSLNNALQQGLSLYQGTNDFMQQMGFTPALRDAHKLGNVVKGKHLRTGPQAGKGIAFGDEEGVLNVPDPNKKNNK